MGEDNTHYEPLYGVTWTQDQSRKEGQLELHA